METIKDMVYLKYKGHPLVKCDDVVYYGNMAEEYVVMMQLLGQQEPPVEELPFALTDTIVVRLMSTDKSKNPVDCVIKSCEKHGLYSALEIASIWLNGALK